MKQSNNKPKREKAIYYVLISGACLLILYLIAAFCPILIDIAFAIIRRIIIFGIIFGIPFLIIKGIISLSSKKREKRERKGKIIILKNYNALLSRIPLGRAVKNVSSFFRKCISWINFLSISLKHYFQKLPQLLTALSTFSLLPLFINWK